MIISSRFPKVAPDSMTARVLLSFLATAGLFYVNIMPALVDGLKEGLAFSSKQAGMVGSFNMYGGACGAFVIAFMARRLNWKPAALWMLIGLIIMDLLSIPVSKPELLMAVRFGHGLIGGALVGLGFSIFARTAAPDRTFGVLLLVQAGAGGLGVMCLPWLVSVFGTPVLFICLIAFSIVTLLMLQFLPAYEVIAPKADTKAAAPLMLTPLLFALCSVFLFQAANMGLYAFIIGLGRQAGLEIDFISETLGIANWVGMLGALLVVILSTHYGIFKPILGGMLLALLGSWALVSSDVKWIWIVSNLITGITWNFVIAYLLGMCARFDQTGQTAVWGGFASKMGLASGPMIGSFILHETQYTSLIWVALLMLLLASLFSGIPAWILDRGVDKEEPAPVPAPTPEPDNETYTTAS
ncbi:MFS transporter [Undibacterium sp. Ji50W]|uniref:MFS transporter n=1 Tax=Undibacterium sp. Ji50W TaxID=3413041 RepID=UPI003BF0B767